MVIRWLRGWELVALLLALGAVIALGLHNAYFVHLSRHGCQVSTPPDCVVRLDNHGAISYVTARQSTLLQLLLLCVLGFAAAAIATHLINLRRRSGLHRDAPPSG